MMFQHNDKMLLINILMCKYVDTEFMSKMLTSASHSMITRFFGYV